MSSRFAANLVTDTEELALTQEQVDLLLDEKMIHTCSECGPTTYHMNLGRTWDEIEACVAKTMTG